MSKGLVLLAAALTAQALLLSGCAGGVNASSIQASEPRRVHSNASVSDLVLCLKGRLGDDASVVAYPEPGRVDIRVGRAQDSDYRFFHLISLRRAQEGSDVEIRSADEWHPWLSASRIAGMVDDCVPGKAR